MYTFPKIYELSTEINTLSTQMNMDWGVDFIPALRIEHDACIFVNAKDKIRFQDIPKCSIFINMLLFSNLRTGYVHFQLLYSRKYKDIRLSLQSFWHIFGIQKLRLYCDSESAFLKGKILTGCSKQKYTSFLESK